MRGAAALCVALAAACGDAAPTTRDLWRLAPATTERAVVVDGPTLEAMRTTLRLVRSALKDSPFADRAAEMSDVLTIGDVALLSPSGPSRVGVDLSRGLGLYFGGGSSAAALHIRDEGRLRRAFPGAAKHCQDHGAVSLCGASAASIAGPPSSLATEALARPASLRGGLEAIFGGTSRGNLAANVERGRANVRVHLVGDDLPQVPALEPHPLARYVASAPASGILIVDVRGVLPLLGRGSDLASTLLAPIRGDMVVVALRGDTPRGWARMGIRDMDAARALLARCDQLPAPPPTQVTRIGDRCEVALGPGLPTFEARIDGDTLLAETEPGAADVKGTPDPHIATLLAAPSHVAVWGRGLATVPALPAAIGAEGIAEAAWWLAHLDELGLAFRVRDRTVEITLDVGTVWQDSDALVADLEPLLTRAAAGEPVADDIAALAAKHPRSRLAHAVGAGTSGLAIPLSLFARFAENLVAALPTLGSKL